VLPPADDEIDAPWKEEEEPLLPLDAAAVRNGEDECDETAAKPGRVKEDTVVRRR
jgi:hypothetical protein